MIVNFWLKKKEKDIKYVYLVVFPGPWRVDGKGLTYISYTSFFCP